MEFKLNSFERFVIKYKSPIIIIIAIVFVIGMFILALNDAPFIAPLSFVLYFILTRLIVSIAIIKNNKILKIRNTQLDLNTALNATTQLIDITNSKDFQSLALFCNNRIAYLIEMGEFEKAENEIKFFWQSFNTKKVSPLTLVAIHTNMASLALEKRDFEAYEEQFGLVCDYHNKSTNKIVKRHSKHSIINLQQLAEAIVANENSNFEEYSARVLQAIHFEPIKEKVLTDEQIPPHSHLQAYEKLFIFTQSIGDTEKAKAQAQQIINIANEQFYIYRKAKEYIENENRSN